MVDPNPAAHAYAWFECHMGQSLKCSPAYYNAWSGWVSDLGELAIIGALISMFRHHNCRIRGCWRLGKQVGNGPILACHKHHPDHPGTQRNVTHDQIIQAQEASCSVPSSTNQPAQRSSGSSSPRSSSSSRSSSAS